MTTVTTPHYSDDLVTLHYGDNRVVLAELADNSVDAIVTDPPYELGFMGKGWDSTGIAYDPVVWAQCLRVLKPGGHLLAFGGTRTWHRLACAVEDAGFEMRDSIAWLYGSGFPKSLDVSKAIDKLDAGAERLVRGRTFQSWVRRYLTPQQINAATGTDMGHHFTTHPTQPSVATADLFDKLRPLLPSVPDEIEALVAQRTVESQNFKARAVIGTARMVDPKASRLGFAGGTYGGTGETHDVDLTTAHTPDAATWAGWGTALKPAFEPIVVARKPLIGTVAANVLQHGTGALNIDASRIAGDDAPEGRTRHGGGVAGNASSYELNGNVRPASPAGRWPANVVLDDSQADALDQQAGDRPGFSSQNDRASRPGGTTLYGGNIGALMAGRREGFNDSGGASRFFPVFGYTNDADLPTFIYYAKAPTSERPRIDGKGHVTVKPLGLIRWLVKLVTPPGGTVADPFAGSGTTGEACIVEGFKSILIENDAEHLPLIVQRVTKPIAPVLLLDGEA